ncbi:MAG: efflux RND transporter periplasmic adaptor subunit [Planctomycetes bacterium]|nr:efflux RND transporter periplasmic adaptor subunit [Planctomycetota bacterium]
MAQPVQPAPVAWRAEIANQAMPLAAKAREVGDDSKPRELSAIPNPGTIDLRNSATVAKAGIELATVEQQPMEQHLVANAVVEYDQNRLAQLSVRTPGTVWRIEKQIGQPIREGDVLAVIEAVDIGKAKADFLQAIVAEELAAKTLERLQQVADSVPDRQVREAAAAAREAHITLHNKQQTLINLGLPIRLIDFANLSDDERVRRLHFLGLPPALTKTLDPEVATANLVALRAPFDGVVIGRGIALGEVVSPNQTQFTIADISRMWIKLDVRQEDAMLVRVGQRVAFHDDSSADVVVGTIDWISTAIDPQTRTLEVRAEVDNPMVPGTLAGNAPQRALRANSFGSGRILVRETQTAFVVPSAAVQTVGEQHVVFVSHGDVEFRPQMVELGVIGPEVTEVRSGLAAGQTIAARGSHVLKAELTRRRLSIHVPAEPVLAAP